MTRIIITGAKGRIGQTVVACASRIRQLQLAASIDLGADLPTVIEKGDVVIDFSFHDATGPIAEACAKHKKALVIGTTGHSAAEQSAIRQFQSTIPMVWASNYSTGVNALFWLTRRAAEILGPAFDPEVVEMHHRMKKDAPSRTAATLAQILAEGRPKQLGEAIQQKKGRDGILGERTTTEMRVHSLRGGDVVGDHTVVLAGLRGGV